MRHSSIKTKSWLRQHVAQKLQKQRVIKIFINVKRYELTWKGLMKLVTNQLNNCTITQSKSIDINWNWEARGNF